MPKDIIYKDDARRKILNGVEKLAKTVAVTMGPKGRNVIIGKALGAPTITKDGVSVAREVVLSDPFEELGCQLVKEVAGRTADVAGDGTTTATVLAHEIFSQGIELMNQGYGALDFRRGAEWALEKLDVEIEKHAKVIQTKEELENIAIISTNNDVKLGKIIAQAYVAVGDNGLVTANAYPGIETSVKVLDGIEIPTGYLSRVYLDANQNEWSVENCYILICNRDITHLADAAALLESIAKKHRSLLILCKDLKKEAATFLYENSARGRMQVCVAKIPVFKGAYNQQLWLEDLAMLVGTKIVDEEMGIPLSEVTIKDLGFARQVTVDIANTKIVASKRSEEAISARLEMYKKDLNKLIGDLERRDIQNRVNFLSSKAAVITVGYSTELELREKGDRVEDAMCAVRAAKEQGYVPGGGITLLKASKNISLSELPEKYHLGAKALLRACERPIRQILENAGENADKIISIILENENFDFGYNIDTGDFGSLLEMGVIDPRKVTSSALRNATTIALLLITTEAAIAEEQEKILWQPPAGYRMPGNKGFDHKY